MADNVTVDNGTGTDYGVAGDKVTYSGDADQTVQLVKVIQTTGAEGSKTVVDPAHDEADGGNPIKIGGKASAASPAAVADGDRVNAYFDLFGMQHVWSHLYDDSGAGGVGTLLTAGADAVSNNTDPLWTAASGYVFNGTTWDRLRAEAGTTGFLGVGGSVAHDATDAGNPIKIGGKASTSVPTAVTSTDRVNAWFDLNGRQIASIFSGSQGAGSDATTLQAWNTVGGADTTPGAVGAHIFNGSSWDRARSGGATGFLGVAGAAAHASPTSGNPVFIAGRASAAIPTDVGADGDAAGMWTNRNGAQMVSTAPHIGLNSDPWNLVHEAAQYTSAQTSTVLVAGGASEKVVVTKVQIQSYGTTAGTCVLYFGTGAYARGTNRAIFDGEFAPSATLKPGVVMDGPFIAGTNGDDVLVTTTNAQSVTISIWYYVIT